MIDAYTHLDLSAAEPIADLERRMNAAGIDRALIVETWSGNNRECLQQLITSPAPAFRIAPCFRPEQPQSGAEPLSLEIVRALRVKTADLHRLGPAATKLQSTRKWLLPHAESGIAVLTEELLRLAASHPELPIYLPHMGWPRHDKQDDKDWLNALLKLSKLPNVIVGVSAIAHFSHNVFPHDDVAPFATRLLEIFGPQRLVAGSDYPLFEKDKYAQYLQLAGNWIAAAEQIGDRFASSLFGKQLVDREG